MKPYAELFGRPPVDVCSTDGAARRTVSEEEPVQPAEETRFVIDVTAAKGDHVFHVFVLLHADYTLSLALH